MSGVFGPDISAALREIPERDRVTFLDMLLHRVQPRQRHEPRRRIFDARHARVYGGFDVIYRLFNDFSAKDIGRNAAANEDRRFWDTLAQHTNIIAENEEGEGEPRWIIADEGSGGIQLHVREGEYSLPVYVGRLVAYNGSDNDELAASRLGYVVRLQRIGDNEVEVAISHIDGEVMPVMVEDQDGVEGAPLRALMIHTKDGKLQLLCDNKDNLITGGRLAIMYGGRHHSGALGKIVVAQTDFSLFALHISE